MNKNCQNIARNKIMFKKYKSDYQISVNKYTVIHYTYMF